MIPITYPALFSHYNHHHLLAFIDIDWYLLAFGASSGAGPAHFNRSGGRYQSLGFKNIKESTGFISISGNLGARFEPKNFRNPVRGLTEYRTFQDNGPCGDQASLDHQPTTNH